MLAAVFCQTQTKNKMKKVTILFKSGNKLVLKCKVFEIYFQNNERKLNIETSQIEAWMIDLKEIEAYTVKWCLF